MNKTFEILMKLTPYLSVLFIFIGLIMAILGAFDHNVKTLTLSLMLIVQSVLLLTYAKSFKKIWKK
jgi:undecaprenyl pyrophosphate phosphatase UppP